MPPTKFHLNQTWLRISYKYFHDDHHLEYLINSDSSCNPDASHQVSTQIHGSGGGVQNIKINDEQKMNNIPHLMGEKEPELTFLIFFLLSFMHTHVLSYLVPRL